MAGKYDPLYRFLADFPGNEWSASFDQVEHVLGLPLPNSAYQYQAWWANDSTHSQGRAWLDAGWETRGVDIYGESVVFVRTGGASWEHPTRTPLTPTGDEEDLGVQGPSLAGSDVMRLSDFEFIHASAIDPKRGADGALLEFMPQSRYTHADTTRLNRYGEGPFCRFDAPSLPPTSGVYAVTVDDGLAYVGIAVDLARRWGPMGYANISPRACFVGGQSTNCKVNHYILLAAQADRRVDLWIHEAADPAPIEARLILQLDPPWNGHRPRAAIVPEDKEATPPGRTRRADPARAASSHNPMTGTAKGSGCLTALPITSLARLLRLFR